MKPTLQPGLEATPGSTSTANARSTSWARRRASTPRRCWCATSRSPAATCCWQHLDPGEDSVGTRVEIDHIGATLLGMEVVLTVRVAEVNGRAVMFDVEGRDAVEPIVRGRHSRFVVDVEKTAQRLAAKAEKAKAAQAAPSGSGG